METDFRVSILYYYYIYALQTQNNEKNLNGLPVVMPCTTQAL